MPAIDSPSLVLEQLYTFLEALALGAALAAIYDLYRAARRQGCRRPPAAALFIVDCLFWIFAALACLVTFIVRRWGEIHLYTYLGLAAGSGGYFYFLSRFFFPVWNRAFACLYRLARKTYRCIIQIFVAVTAPFRWTVEVVQKSRDFFIRCRSRIIDLSRRMKA